MPDEITIAEFAAAKDMHPESVRRAIREGRIKPEHVRRFGQRVVLISSAALEDFTKMESRARTQKAKSE